MIVIFLPQLVTKWGNLIMRLKYTESHRNRTYTHYDGMYLYFALHSNRNFPLPSWQSKGIFLVFYSVRTALSIHHMQCKASFIHEPRTLWGQPFPYVTYSVTASLSINHKAVWGQAALFLLYMLNESCLIPMQYAVWGQPYLYATCSVRAILSLCHMTCEGSLFPSQMQCEDSLIPTAHAVWV